jgi:nitrate/nitrite-specific signal transduction histidine kinase
VKARTLMLLVACALLALAISAWLSWRTTHASLSVKQAQELQMEELRGIAQATTPSSNVKPLYQPPQGFVKPNIATGGDSK